MNKAVLFIAAAGAVVLVLVLIDRRASAQNIGVAVGQGVVDTASGVVLGIGDGIGIPRTDLTECERAKAEGRTWDASFACPAGNFAKYLFS
jgi:hypothetical protein